MGVLLSFMIFKVFRNLAAAVLLLRRRAQAAAAARTAADDALLGAYDAYRAGDPIKFAAARAAISTAMCSRRGSTTGACRCGWKTLPNQEVREFFATHAAALRRRAAARRLAARARQARRLGRVRAPGARSTRATTSRSAAIAWLSRLERGDDSAFADAMARCGSSRASCPRAASASPTRCPRAAAVDHRRLAPGARAVRATARSPRRKTALGSAAEGGSARRARCSPRRRASPKRLLARAAEGARAPRRRAKSRCSPRALRARRCPTAAAERCEGPLGERLPRARAEVPVGPRRLRGARASTTSARSSGSRAPATRRSTTASSPGRRAPRCAPAEWQAVRDVDRPHVARPRATTRPGSTGTAARSPRRATRPAARAYFLRIAGQTDFYGLLASEELGYVADAARGDRTCRPSRKSRRPAQSRASRARSS